VDATTASGTLIIQTASLDTKNAKRDTHLRGTDFFDAEKHPTIVFTLAGAESAHGHVHLDGTLALPGGSVPLTLHTDAETGDRLELHTGTEISRAAAGLTWNQAGMIKDTVLLIADVTLIPA
jgi:polyisoprenoid-binding protein YceI